MSEVRKEAELPRRRRASAAQVEKRPVSRELRRRRCPAQQPGDVALLPQAVGGDRAQADAQAAEAQRRGVVGGDPEPGTPGPGRGPRYPGRPPGMTPPRGDGPILRSPGIRSPGLRGNGFNIR